MSRWKRALGPSKGVRKSSDWATPASRKMQFKFFFKFFLLKHETLAWGDHRPCIQWDPFSWGPVVSPWIQRQLEEFVHVFSWWLLAKWEIWSINHEKPFRPQIQQLFLFFFLRWGILSNSCVLLWSLWGCDTLLGWVNLACSSFLITSCVVAKGCRLSSRCYFEVLAWFDWNWTVGQ